MDKNQLLSVRLSNLNLTNPSFEKPEDVVSFLGAVQSQDFFGAKWAIGLRMKNSNNIDVEKAFNEGRILRTHALRPTWHFVTPEDIRWITELNAPQVKRIMNYYNRKLELDSFLFKKTNSIISDALEKEKFLTRTELAKILEKKGIKASGQRLGHIVGEAELDCLICSGPLKGKQFTYALLESRAPNAKKYSREESLGNLANVFFKTRGPATIKDFSKWSGLSVSDSKIGFDSVKSNFESETIDNQTYYFKHQPSPPPSAHLPPALLLPNYDEYISSYSDYSLMTTERTKDNLMKIGNAQFWNHMVLDGIIIGSWRRVFKPKLMEIEFAPLLQLTDNQVRLFEKQAKNVGNFFGLQTIIK